MTNAVNVAALGSAPAFYAYLSAGQSIGAAGFTKLTLDTEKYDTNNNFASNKFTPTVAGYYQITGSIAFGTTASLVITSIYKNGSRDAMNETIFAGSLTGGSTLSCSTIIYMNGTTDYLELYAYSNSTGNSIQGGSGTPTFLTGALIRSA